MCAKSLQLVKNLPAMWETWVPSLGWKGPLEKGKATDLQYSVLENSLDCIVHGVAKSQTKLSDFHTHTHTHTHFKSFMVGTEIKEHVKMNGFRTGHSFFFFPP